MSVLEMKDLVVTFPDGDDVVTALDHVDFRVEKGEFVAVVGESGSGKSTLLTVAAGLLTPDSGTLHAQKVGLVFQSANLLGSLSAREQLLIIDHLNGLRPRIDRADHLLARVGLKGLENRYPHQLSGGQRQRVNIARALMGEPEVLLADEPTSALDARLSSQIVELMRELSDELGIATVLVTHDRSQLSCVSRAVEMVDGQLKPLVEAV